MKIIKNDKPQIDINTISDDDITALLKIPINYAQGEIDALLNGFNSKKEEEYKPMNKILSQEDVNILLRGLCSSNEEEFEDSYVDEKTNHIKFKSEDKIQELLCECHDINLKKYIIIAINDLYDIMIKHPNYALEMKQQLSLLFFNTTDQSKINPNDYTSKIEGYIWPSQDELIDTNDLINNNEDNRLFTTLINNLYELLSKYKLDNENEEEYRKRLEKNIPYTQEEVDKLLRYGN